MNERIYYSEEAARRAQRDRAIMALVVTSLGVGVGAMLMLLFAPQRGEQTRRQIGEQIEQALSQGQETLNSTLKSLRGDVDDLRSTMNERLEAMRR